MDATNIMYFINQNICTFCPSLQTPAEPPTAGIPCAPDRPGPCADAWAVVQGFVATHSIPPAAAGAIVGHMLAALAERSTEVSPDPILIPLSPDSPNSGGTLFFATWFFPRILLCVFFCTAIFFPPRGGGVYGTTLPPQDTQGSPPRKGSFFKNSPRPEAMFSNKRHLQFFTDEGFGLRAISNIFWLSRHSKQNIGK